MFLLALATWSYFGIIEDRGLRPWIIFAAASVLLVWSNYFGFVFLFLLLADLLDLPPKTCAQTRPNRFAEVMVIVAAAFLPLIPIAVHDIVFIRGSFRCGWDWKNAIAVAGYPSFAIFGSAAIAPWYLPLSIPVFLGHSCGAGGGVV